MVQAPFVTLVVTDDRRVPSWFLTARVVVREPSRPGVSSPTATHSWFHEAISAAIFEAAPERFTSVVRHRATVASASVAP